MSRKEKLDLFLSRWISRKLTVFAIASVALFKEMNLDDIRLYTLNASAMAISFTNAERALKILLLAVSIIYTVLKIIEMKNKKDEANK
jgi:hypothetical protein